ncbi:MAG: hypothetical protein UHW86_08815 [Spirochaetota bacterium]|nr:hypothetical protein [Spirochaetota bacterium]
MKHYFLLLILLFLSGCDICDPATGGRSPQICEYNPSKAGADIVEQYYIANLFQEKQEWTCIFNQYNDKLYFVTYFDTNKYISVVNKTTMQVEKNILIPFPFENIKIRDFALHNNKILFFIKTEEYGNALFSFDQSDNTVKEIIIETLGIDINKIDNFGIDCVTGKFYFRIHYDELQFFTYDETNNTCSVSESVNTAKLIYWDYRCDLDLYNNVIYSPRSYQNMVGQIRTYIRIRNLSDISEKLKKIDLNYLNSIYVYNVLYDGEFIWTITNDKNCNLQLLKLKLL